MTTDPVTALGPDFDPGTTLTAAAAAFGGEPVARPDAKTVVRALVQAEKAAKRQHLVFPFAALQGQWRLCFTAPRKAHEQNGVVVGKGWYVPKLAPAHISFQPAQSSEPTRRGEIVNQLQLGAIRLKFTGPCRYPGKKNLLDFDFTQIQLFLFGRPVYQGNFRGGKAQEQDFSERSITQLPFFAFFWITEDFIAARGRGGGLALWVRTKN